MIDVVVPVGGTDPQRVRVLDWVLSWWEAEGFRVTVGYDSGCAWSKGRAVADAVSRTSGDVLVVADADSFCDRKHLDWCLAEVAGGVAWAQPHSIVRRLSPSATTRVLNGRDGGHGWIGHEAAPGGGIVVLPRQTWDACPIDPRFEGWGGEDISWARALTTLHGPQANAKGVLWHLWHPPAVLKRRGSPETERLAGEYLEAVGDPERMAKLLR